MNKKIGFFAVMAAIIATVGGCQKEELTDRQLTDKVQPQVVVQSDVYVEDDYLVFKDYETLDSLKKHLLSLSIEEIKSFETKMGFNSAYMYRQNAMCSLENLSDNQLLLKLSQLTDEGYFDGSTGEFTFPFQNETFAVILNSEGKIKIGRTYYQFKGNEQLLTPDLKSTGLKDKPEKYIKKVIVNEELSKLKSAEKIAEALTKDGQLRTSLKVYREEIRIYDWIIHPIDGIVWGYVGSTWDVYYKFYSYRQYSLYKADRETYFHWKTRQASIGGNDGYWYLNYYNPNPYQENSNYCAKFYFLIYSSGLTASMYRPTVHNINVEFWTDKIPSYNTLIYPN